MKVDEGGERGLARYPNGQTRALRIQLGQGIMFMIFPRSPVQL